MPYITRYDRKLFDPEITAIVKKLNALNWQPGAVNYIFFSILLNWWAWHKKYETICKIMGTLACVSQEFYRTTAAPYEDEKELKNGRIKVE